MNPASSIAIQRPSLTLLGTEPLRAAIEYVSHKLARANQTIQGDSHPVILFPGLGADATSLIPLREHCRSLVYQAIDWGRGYNTGPQGNVDVWLSQLAQHVLTLLVDSNHSATLIGWSLGGLYAREIAKLTPRRVRQVITVGTPFNADADHTNVGWVYRLVNGTAATIDPAMSARLRAAPPVPTTSIYSRTDGVVAWQTCRHDREARHVEDIEIKGSHLGMGWHRAVLNIVGDRLAQRPGEWQPYNTASRSPARYGTPNPGGGLA